MLKDIGELVIATKENLANKFIPADVELSEGFKQAYTAYQNERGEDAEFLKNTAIITTGGNLNIYVANQWFVIASYAVELVSEVIKYKSITDEIIKEYFSYREYGNKVLDKVYQELRNKNGEFIDKFAYASEQYLIQEGTEHDKVSIYQERLLRFVTDYNWWLGGKGLERTNDYFVSPALRVLNLVNASQEFVAKLVYAYVTVPELKGSLSEINKMQNKIENSIEEFSINKTPRMTGGKNLIVYGAPGTGKSRKLESDFGSKEYTKRVVFHPEYSYYDFIGNYKPSPLYKKTEECLYDPAGHESNKGVPFIDYVFVAGPFTEILVEAWHDPSNMYTLFIEELNRADASAVFGEIFQLLDRNSDGSSKYSYEPSKELKDYLISRGIEQFIEKGVSLPSNLNIVATMNSADQGVNILDSAFKRRWNFEYMRIDIENAAHKNALIKYNGSDMFWGAFVTGINEKLKNLRVNEDKLIGPYFIAPAELKSRAAIDKLLLYLWDDILRHRRDEAFNKNIKCFTDLVDNFEVSDVLQINEFISEKTTDSFAGEEEINDMDEDAEAN